MFSSKCPSRRFRTPPPAQCTINARRMMTRITTTNQKKNTTIPGIAYPATDLALATASSYPAPPDLSFAGRQQHHHGGGRRRVVTEGSSRPSGTSRAALPFAAKTTSKSRAHLWRDPVRKHAIRGVWADRARLRPFLLGGCAASGHAATSGHPVSGHRAVAGHRAGATSATAIPLICQVSIGVGRDAGGRGTPDPLLRAPPM